MHELGITRSVVAICAEHANGTRVKRVTLEIGKLSAILPDAVRFCFDICAKGTVVEGAQLEIIEIPGMAICRQCQRPVPLVQPFGRCDCGSNDLEQIAGHELKVKEMETI
ncbi:MAG: hydrogenase maturation nickel metallochaperone HypA [Blastocatellia bacterium]|nr:hydrogenase maturation nickel metallochaperone HypA [Blastocatellia bacterium]